MVARIPDSLLHTQKLIWPIIENYLIDPLYPNAFRIPERFNKDAMFYWKINRDYPERKGKYIRPTLLLLTCEALGGKKELALKTAAAMQLSEDWILIHDDIEDKSEERRGKPALHRLYGNELAINAGDALHAIMWKMIDNIGVKKLTDEFYKMLMRTILGQGVEQMWTNKKKELINKNEYFFIADGKSAYYSIAGPMRLGAIAANAKSSQVDKITDFGLHLGRCFQLVDDILDIEQDKQEGKMTLATYKGQKFTKRMATKEMVTAKDIFKKDLKFLSKEPARSNLAELIDFILKRDY